MTIFLSDSGAYDFVGMHLENILNNGLEYTNKLKINKHTFNYRS